LIAAGLSVASGDRPVFFIPYLSRGDSVSQNAKEALKALSDFHEAKGYLGVAYAKLGDSNIYQDANEIYDSL
jgi:hypothetical protein